MKPDDDRIPKLRQNGLFMVDCPKCNESWKISVDEDEEDLYVYCACYGKEPERIVEWVSRFMSEKYDSEDSVRGYQ